MVYRIVCPKQQPEAFELDACYHCPRFQLTINKGRTYSCRENRQPAHKRDYEGAWASRQIGLPDTVEIEAAREKRPTG